MTSRMSQQQMIDMMMRERFQSMERKPERKPRSSSKGVVVILLIIVLFLYGMYSAGIFDTTPKVLSTSSEFPTVVMDGSTKINFTCSLQYDGSGNPISMTCTKK